MSPPIENRNKNCIAYSMGVVSAIEPLYSVAIQLNTFTAVGIATRNVSALKMVAASSPWLVNMW